MSTKLTSLNVEKREKVGKGAARATRRAGMIPGVIYGDKKNPVLISISPRDMEKEMNTTGLWTRQFELHVGKDKYRALCQDIQKHPVTDRPLHVDFLRISRDSEITVDVHVSFLNEETCAGIKLGGVLNIVRRTIEIHCKPDDIPEHFVVDLAGLQIGDAVKISDIDLPKGVRPVVDDRDFTIATIAAPTVVKDDEDAAATEGEAAEAASEAKE
ncbi:MAG: 50S ribosomal protein L25/general stress protein Ctc [Alphaproteobacteria bacterium]